MEDARTTVLKAEREDAIVKRDRLNVYIDALSERLGIPLDDTTQPQDEQLGATTSGPLADDVLTLVYDNEFHSMKMPEAAEKVLRRWSPEGYRRPLKTTALMEALRKGGIKIKESRVLYRSLYSAPRMKRLEGGLWGLAEWYGQEQRKPAAKPLAEDTGGEPAPSSGETDDVDVLAGTPEAPTREGVGAAS